MGRRVVTQAHFDELVRENMEEFEMSREEALKSTISELGSQGVDLSGVDTTDSDEKREWRRRVEEAVSSLPSKDALLTIRDLCASDESCRRVLESCDGAAGLCEAIESDHNASLALQAWKSALGETNKSTFRYHRGPAACMAALDRSDKEAKAAALALAAAACARCEDNKVAFSRMKGFCKLVVDSLDDSDLGSVAADVVRVLAAADDASTSTSTSFDTSRQLVDVGAVDSLVAALASGGSSVDAPAALGALRSLAKSDDAVKRIRRVGGSRACAQTLRKCLADDDGSDSRVDVATKCIGLIRNISGNDDAKDAMVDDGTLDLVLAACRRYSRRELREHALATVAQMALRRPRNADKIVAKGGADLVLDSMREAPDAVHLQRQGCLALRNIVARDHDAEHKRPIIEAGAEDVLRLAASKSQANVDVAYAALRDLGIEAQIKTYEISAHDASVVVPKATFGDKANTNFRPVFHESDNVASQIQAEAAANENAIVGRNNAVPAVF